MTAAAGPRSASRALPLRLARRHGQEIVILLALLALFAVVGAINPRFLGTNNLVSIFSGNSYIAVAAIGMAVVIITGHIDVSVGALIGVLATVAGTLVTHGYPVAVAWGVPVVLGIAVDAVIGVLVAYAGIPSIVVTPRHAVDPARRPHHGHGRRLDLGPAAGLSCWPRHGSPACRCRSSPWWC